uniref:uncharacterized protein LOC117600122 n=1 Tax=Osmia lignaria TaxID=473952 RepID=UPI0014791526|nr:uncharacterized protein LOC117600122 [Osmia lignaria]
MFLRTTAGKVAVVEESGIANKKSQKSRQQALLLAATVSNSISGGNRCPYVESQSGNTETRGNTHTAGYTILFASGLVWSGLVWSVRKRGIFQRNIESSETNSRSGPLSDSNVVRIATIGKPQKQCIIVKEL